MKAGKEEALKHFLYRNFFEIFVTFFIILVGGLLLSGDFSDNRIINIIHELDGICFIVAGLIGLCGAVYVNKNLPDGEIYCWANGRGPYTVFNNFALGFFAVLLAILLMGYESDEYSGAIVFSIMMVLSIFASMYGIFYRNTNCIVIGQGHVYKVAGRKTIEIDLTQIVAYTFSIRFAGYRLIDRDKKIVMKWSSSWNEGNQVTRFLNEQNVKFVASKSQLKQDKF